MTDLEFGADLTRQFAPKGCILRNTTRVPGSTIVALKDAAHLRPLFEDKMAEALARHVLKSTPILWRIVEFDSREAVLEVAVMPVLELHRALVAAWRAGFAAQESK